MSLVESLNEIREETINFHYNVAYTELKEKIKESPLITDFFIYSGCVSREITEELVKRFTNNGLDAKLMAFGIFSIQYYLNIKVSLPETLEKK